MSSQPFNPGAIVAIVITVILFIMSIVASTNESEHRGVLYSVTGLALIMVVLCVSHNLRNRRYSNEPLETGFLDA